MYSIFKGARKPGKWRNPDLHIRLSFLFYFLFILMIFLAPVITPFFRDGIKVVRALTLLFLLAGAIFSGVANNLATEYELYPGYMEEPSEEVLEEMDNLLQARRKELQAKQTEESEPEAMFEEYIADKIPVDSPEKHI